jgi:hypothetical protein
VDSENSDNQVVFDKDTNEPGALISVSGLKLLGAGKAEVKGAVFQGRLCDGGGTFIVMKADGQWKISKEVIHWEA